MSKADLALARSLTEAGPVLLYDGNCGVCSVTVQWILAHERPGSRLRFAALESPVGQTLREATNVPASLDSLLWIEQTESRVRALTRSSAALRVAAEARGAYRLLGLLRAVPPFLRDAAYDAFARVRHRIAAPVCLVPLPEQKARFLS